MLLHQDVRNRRQGTHVALPLALAIRDMLGSPGPPKNSSAQTPIPEQDVSTFQDLTDLSQDQATVFPVQKRGFVLVKTHSSEECTSTLKLQLQHRVKNDNPAASDDGHLLAHVDEIMNALLGERRW